MSHLASFEGTESNLRAVRKGDFDKGLQAVFPCVTETLECLQKGECLEDGRSQWPCSFIESHRLYNFQIWYLILSKC